MKTLDLLILLGAGGVLVYVLSRQKGTPAPAPTANVNTGRTPLSNLTFVNRTAETPQDWSGLVTAGSAAVKGIFDTISPWFKKSTNSLSSGTAAQMKTDEANKSTWVDAPARSGSAFDFDYEDWV